MKLTTARLKKLIREELNRITEVLGTESRESLIRKLKKAGIDVYENDDGSVTYRGEWVKSGESADLTLRKLAKNTGIYDSSVGYGKRKSVIDDTDPVTGKPFKIQVDGNQDYGRMAQDGNYTHPHTSRMISKAVEIYPETYTLMMAKNDRI